MVFRPRCEIWKYFDNIVEEGVAVCKLCKQRLRNERSYSLRKHISKLHNPSSDVWKYFLNFTEQGVAECKICKKHVRNNRQFNLALHLKKHNIIIVEKTEDEYVSTSASTASTNAILPSSQVIESFYILMEEKTFVNAVMGLMIDEGVVPAIFSSKNMQALLNPVCDAISKQNDKKFSISELQSGRAIQSVSSFMRNDFAKGLRWRLLSLRIDSAASLASNMFCVSVQFVNEAQIEACILGDIHLEEGEQLSSECIMKVLSEFKIDAQQIVSAYWTNAKTTLSHSVSNLEYLEQIREYEKTPDVFIGDVKLERYIGVITQLCVFDILKNHVILKLFLECRNLAKFITRKPDIFSEAFKQNSLNMPQLDSPWKWDSTYSMMTDLNNARCMLSNLKYEPPEFAEDHFNLNENLKNFIAAFCKALRFLHKCSQMFHNSQMIYGDFYGHWLKCKLLTEKLCAACTEEDKFLALISSQLLKSLETRSDELLNQDHFKACLYLDPRFQGTLNIPEKMFALEYLKQLWQRAKLYNKELVDPVAEPLPVKSASRSLKLDDDDDNDDILNEFLSRVVQEAGSTGIYKKLEELKLPFQTVETNVLLFWKELKAREPEIYTLATICFAIPATHNYNKTLGANQQPSIYARNISPTLSKDVNYIRLNQQLLQKAMDNLNLFEEDDVAAVEISQK